MADEHVHLSEPGGVDAQLKVPNAVAGMVAGADSIDLVLLRHGALKRLFTVVPAPFTWGTLPALSFTYGHVRQINAVASRLLNNSAGSVPLLPGAAELDYVDVDDTRRQTYGYATQGAGHGYTGIKGLNALLAMVSTLPSAPSSSPPGCARGRRTRPAAPTGSSPTR